MTREVALRNYEDFLIGKKKLTLKGPTFAELSKQTEKGSEEEYNRLQNTRAYKEADALAILRYAITDILGWSPEDAFHHLDETVVRDLKLDAVFRYISYPKDVNPNRDYWWMVYKAFPTQVTYNSTKKTLDLYKSLMKGEIGHFPKFTFDGPEGIERLNVILHYFITNNIPANSLEELYEAFGDKAKISKKLKEAQLYYAFKNKFRTPLDWLHHSLGEDADDFLYHFHQYLEACKVVEQVKGKLKKT